MGGISLSLQRGSLPLFLLATAVSFAAAFWAYRRTLPPLPPRTRRLLLVLRFAALTLLFLLLMDPLVTVEKSETLRPNVAVLVDRSASMGIADRGAGEGGGETRAAIAERLLRADDTGIEAKLGKRYDFAEERFAATLATATDSGSVDATDIARALEGTVEKNWERGVDAVVLLTDGIANAGRDPVRAAEEIGVPVFPVPIGDPSPPRDIALEQVLANPLVYVKSRVTAEVTICGKGFAGEEASVYLKEGSAVLAEGRVRFQGKRGTEVVPLSFTVTEPGVRRYVVETPVREGELVSENNRIPFTVEVVKEKLEVVFLAERPSWDFAFLRRTLERDPNVHCRFFVQGKDGKPDAAGGEEEGGFPYAEQDLQRVDLVLLSGIPSVVGREWGAALQRYVSTRGGALVFVAADPLPSMPEPLAELLPVIPEGRSFEFDPAPFSPRLTEEGKRHPMLRIFHDAVGGEGEWKALPPLLGWNRIGPLRPGSVLLAAHPSADIGGREAPVLAFRAVGKGRVLLVDGGGVWRWGFEGEETADSSGAFVRFWSNAVRWLAAREGFRNVTVKPESITYNRGESVTFRGLVMNEALVPVADARVEVTLAGPDGHEQKFQVEPDPSDPGAYRRTLAPLPPGDYTYAAAVTRGEAPLGEDKGEFTVSDFSAEFLETERNDALLRSVARASGGRVLPAEDMPSWQGDLGLASRVRRVREEREIWNSLAFFLLLIGFFSFEWLIRKRSGLS